jgi:diamine N-acetyltransferase
MNIKIIIADSSHADIISMIGKQSFRDAFAHLFVNKDELQEYLSYVYEPAKVRRSIEKENNVFFLAFLETVPVGFAKLKKDSLHEKIESIAQMELQKIYVLSYYHGSGVGAALLETVINYAKQREPDFLWLDTHTSNVKAIRFYEKNGFKKTAKNYFTIGSQTFEYHVMRLPIAVNEPCYC